MLYIVNNISITHPTPYIPHNDIISSKVANSKNISILQPILTMFTLRSRNLTKIYAI
nr:MAG TPA: hypothetical protein [Crassvirales sp.]